MKETVINAIKRLMVQGEQCLVDGKDSHCLYYKDGKRCIVGWMLTEDSAKELKENELGVSRIPDHHFIASFGKVPEKKEMALLKELQSIHDSSNYYDFYGSFKRFTEKSVAVKRLPKWVLEGFV